TTFLFDEGHEEQPEVIHEEWDYTRHWAHFRKELKKGKTYRFAVLGSACSTEQIPDPHNEAERLTIFGKLEGIDRIEEYHNAAWDKLWESDIIIEGDLESQRAVRSMIYHLYSFTRAGQAYSLSPMGLSGLGYNGHVFWDTEIWMYPSILLLNPDMARSLLEYRFQRMEAARINAFSHGYKGVMFPWESADTGQECTPVWALTGPFQHHITGDIGWAFWKYYQLTKDEEFLETRAYPVLREVAEFWCSRVERNGPGQYDIKNVIGANEYEENIDNNAYTNGMAITVLGYATEAAKALGLEPNPDWAHVAENIPILTFEDGVTRENATYNGAVIKQADVNLLAYPMNIISGKENIQKDLAYYEGRMDPIGPALGWSVLAVLYARMQEPETAFKWFEQSHIPNEVPPFAVMAETAGGTNPYFATGAGGALQVLLNGFGGLELNQSGLNQLDTKLPKAWKSLTLKGIGPDKKTYTVK
ncbi:MAG: glycoside hydrolase family 65 protein, partial [Bacteroidota bacterium]